MADPRASQLARIQRAARMVELRLRLGRVLRVAPYVLVAGLGVAGAVLAVHKALPRALSEGSARRVLLALAALSVGALLAAALRRLPPRAGTIALDKAHELAGRLTNGIAFASTPQAQRSPLMEVAIDDACDHAKELSPRRAAPLETPRDLLAPLCVAAGVAMIAMLEVRTIIPPAPKAATIDALTMAPDDLDLFRDAAKELAKRDQSAEVQAAIDRFNQLIEDIANKRLDRTEAFRRLEAIERELLKGAEADSKALEDALEQTARELKRSDLARPIGDSLEKKDLEKAKKDLQDLAKKLREKKKPSKADLDKLRQALERAAERREESLAALEEKRAEAREDLLKKKQKSQPDGGAPDQEEQRLLKKKERELERLDREAERQQQAQRKLDKLDRDLAKAAEDLMKDLGASAEDLERAAEDINRLQQEEMSDKEKEELRQKLEEMREVLRQQGQGGQQRMARMKRFGKRARGDQSDSGLEGEGQQQGGGQNGRPTGEDGEDEGEGQDGKGKGEKGQGQGQGQGGQQWVLGPGGKKILIPGMGKGGQQGQGQGQQGQGQQDGKGDGGGQGKGVGSQHDGNVAGKRTDPKMDTVDVQAQGLDTQQGPSNSEVILSAAERGFRGGSYKKVFRDYHTVAEQQINKDQIPDGYRFYVHRYFQLIRPRD